MIETFLIGSGVVFWACLILFLVGLAIGSNSVTFYPTIRNGKKEE
jgi:hypothetical protein